MIGRFPEDGGETPLHLQRGGDMMKKFAISALAVALALAAALPARAGFRIQEVDPEFPTEITTSWFQEGKARIDGALEGLSVIIDVKGGEGWLVDAAQKRYAGGKIEVLAEELRKIEEEQAEDDALAGDEAEDEKAAKPLSVQVKDMGAGDKLLGYETRRYQVLVDGELLEELWVAPKLEISKEIDLTAFQDSMQKMLGGGTEVSQGYEKSEAYRTLRAGGYPLRQVLYFVGEKSTLEVKSVAVEALPTTDFAVPKGLTKVGYTDLLLGESE
jgi:hypothetical protein